MALFLQGSIGGYILPWHRRGSLRRPILDARETLLLSIYVIAGDSLGTNIKPKEIIETYNELESLGLVTCVRPKLAGSLGTGGSRVADPVE
jgi:hypothetical protein